MTDTIDLQAGQTSPSAQDHSRKPPQNAAVATTAPHQTSELRHIAEERHLEEEHLSNAWNQANGLSDEPPSEDEERYPNGMNGQEHGDADAQQNGGSTGENEDADMRDNDGDSMDDDMMDKISSSPSISDGVYISSSPPQWPERSSSIRTLITPPKRSSIERLSNGSDADVESDASSPYFLTPLHLPLRYYSPTPGSSRNWSQPGIPLEEEADSSSPFTMIPEHYPLGYRPRMPARSEGHHHHHRMGEYHNYNEPTRNRHDDYESAKKIVQEKTSVISSIYSEGKYPEPDSRRDFYQQPQLVKSASDMELERQLLPDMDPLLDYMEDADVIADFATSKRLSNNSLLDDDGDENWETDSDGNLSLDSFQSVLYNDDDDDKDLHFPTDERFIDSGWGGECLRETEDIDFDLVYALHTFVATVEGQANAQKGDEMVLLDDSNSYWWLVRVVKDSTIGTLA
jgi:hypothetical protein